MILDDILQQIDVAIQPANMYQQQALDWLENLSLALDSRMEALRDEIKNANA